MTDLPDGDPLPPEPAKKPAATKKRKLTPDQQHDTAIEDIETAIALAYDGVFTACATDNGARTRPATHEAVSIIRTWRASGRRTPDPNLPELEGPMKRVCDAVIEAYATIDAAAEHVDPQERFRSVSALEHAVKEAAAAGARHHT